MLDQITPLILTFDEAPNIRRTMEKLLWARRIVVVDSNSKDETLNILADYPQAEVIEHSFTDYATQWNFGLSQVRTPWVLSLDADYEISSSLIDEIGKAIADQAIAGYRARFIYRMHGQKLRGTLYPPRVVLYQKDKAYYYNEGHAMHLTVDGLVSDLTGVIYHDDRKSLSRWFTSQKRYAAEEALYLLQTPTAKLKFAARIRRMGWPLPLGIFFYTLFVKGCILDGWLGWSYALQRLVAETMIALEIVDRRLHGADKHRSAHETAPDTESNN